MPPANVFLGKIAFSRWVDSVFSIMALIKENFRSILSVQVFVYIVFMNMDTGQ